MKVVARQLNNELQLTINLLSLQELRNQDLILCRFRATVSTFTVFQSSFEILPVLEYQAVIVFSREVAFTSTYCLCSFVWIVFKEHTAVTQTLHKGFQEAKNKDETSVPKEFQAFWLYDNPCSDWQSRPDEH